MSFNFLEELGKSIKKTIEKETEKTKLKKIDGIDENEVDLAQKLDAIEEYTIDRFEEDKVVLEDRKTGEIKNIEKAQIPKESKEGDILKCINGKFFVDKEETLNREKEIQNKFKDLWK